MELSASQMAVMSRLLDEALPLDTATRRAWLEKLSPEYSDIAPALWEALLPSQARAAGALGTLPKLPAGQASAGPARSRQAGARVGPYELIRALGAGGMAEVWLARRADGAMKRTVALKMPTLILVRSELEQRFARERDILASLEHTHIARLYDAGIDPDGQPYLAMEYVEGQPLTDWCDAHRLPIAARLELCLQVLEALQYAHDRHVVHRDLKPSNILVTDSGQVRLLDFGVAKLLEEEADQAQLTSVYGRALTPDYASPELLRGERLDARCDIYSFGVAMYELLIGIRPYQLKSAGSVGLLEQAIASVEVEKPSLRAEPQAAALRATTPEGLARQLRGDLDAIAVKTLAKEPAERYPSAADLAKDLRSYLERRPVAARPAGFVYRLRKFVRRNRTIVAVSGVAVATVLIAFGFVLYRGTPHSVAVKGATSESPPTLPFNPPPHSIAVLPFTNLSGDPKQEYFSDGMSEELINALSHIESMSVAARTSAFSFKGQNADIGTIGRKLNVSAVLEGSVRRSGHRVRITAQLINTTSGFHVWSEDYDRDLNDNLELQTEIATAVAQELEARLLGSEAARIELGGTHNSEAYDAYLRGTQLAAILGDELTHRASAKEFDRAISIDPNYALAYAARALQLIDIVVTSNNPETREQLTREASDSARRALTLAPDLSEAHGALSFVLALGFFDFSSALAESKRALELAPGSDLAQEIFAMTSGWAGHHDDAIRSFLAAVRLDPQNFRNRINLASEYNRARRFSEALTAVRDAEAIKPDGTRIGEVTAQSYLGMGQALQAKRACEDPTLKVTVPLRYPHWCLALAYHLLGDLANAERELTEYLANSGEGSAYERGELYAQLGRPTEALMWLSTAYRLRDPDLQNLKMDWMLDPIRNEHEFKAIERGLNFPP